MFRDEGGTKTYAIYNLIWNLKGLASYSSTSAFKFSFLRLSDLCPVLPVPYRLELRFLDVEHIYNNVYTTFQSYQYVPSPMFHIRIEILGLPYYQIKLIVCLLASLKILIF